MANLLQIVPPVSGAVIGGITMIVSALKVSSRGNAVRVQEFDVSKREAEVFLFTSHLHGLPVPDSTEFRHWALVFCFDGDDIRTVEGLVDEETKLYAVYSKVPPQEEGKYYNLGKVSTSPKMVAQLCERNKYNFLEYLPTWQNCQSWVKELATKLGGEIASKLDKFPTLMEARPTFAKIAKYSMASGNFSSRPFQKSFNMSKGASGPKNKIN